MDDDIEMVDAPNHRGARQPEVGRPGLRPPPGFEHLVSSAVGSESGVNSSSPGSSPVLSPRSPSPEEASVELGPSGSASEDHEMAGSRDHEISGQQCTQSEIPPLRINKVRDGDSPMASDLNSQGSESDLVGEPGNQPLVYRSIWNSPPTTHSNDQGSECGIFPFPPPAGDSTSQDAAPDPDPNEKHVQDPQVIGPKTHAYLNYHHHHQILGLMHRKIDDIKVNEEWENCNIFHLDWSAGNPKDPQTVPMKELEHIGHGKGRELSEEDSALRDQIAELVKSFVDEVQGHPKDDEWSKTMFFGDWITNSTNENVYFLETQIKRISGADDDLMKRCGISSRHVWYPLADPDYYDPIPCSQGSSPLGENVQRPVSPEPLLRSPTARIIGPQEETGETEYPERPTASIPHSAAFSSLHDIIRTARDRRVMNLDEVITSNIQDPVDPVDPALQLVGPIEPGPSFEERMDNNTPPGPSTRITPLENIDPSLIDSSDVREPNGLPRLLPSLPVDQSSSWGSNISNSGSLVTNNNNNGNDGNDDNGKSNDDSIATDDEGFDKAYPRVRNLLAFQKTLRDQREQTLNNLLNAPDFPQRKANSYIYCVRVIAIPEVNPISNHFTGPKAIDRKATLLASGGWIVPPLEERLKWQHDNKENRPVLPENSDDIATQYFRTIPGTPPPPRHEHTAHRPSSTTSSDQHMKKAQVCRALPVEFDWSGECSPRYFGEPCPVWRELSEPCLEDVYWMVWQLLSGKQYVGFRSGSGFGRNRTGTSGEAEILLHCPFQSPSPEALHLSSLQRQRL